MLFGLGTKAWAAIGAVIIVGGGIAIAGAAIADDGDFDPILEPEWKAGYKFSYAVDAELETVFDASENLTGALGTDLPPELDVTLGPLQLSKEVLNTQYEANGQPVYVSAANLPVTTIQQGGFPDFSGADQVQAWPAAERQSDLAPTWVQPDWDCRSNDCQSGGLHFGDANPFTYLAFPLTEGKRWSQEAELPMLEDLGHFQDLTKVHMVGEVGGMESIELGGDLGNTDAVRVDFSYTPVGLQGFVNDMAAQAEAAGMELERFDVQLGLHEIVHYSPEYEAVVRDQWIVRGLVDLAFTGEFRGYQLDEFVYTEFNALVTAQLNGAELVEGPERSPLQILQVLGNKDLVQDVQGKASVKTVTPYTLDLRADRTEVNAAEDDPATILADLEGVDALPEGHTMRYEVVDAVGETVHTGDFSGDALVYSFGDPGVYTFLVRAYDADGDLSAQDSIVLIAGYETEVDADCYALQGCEAEDVPVRAGIQGLVVEADARDIVDLQQGRLVLDTGSETLYGDGDNVIELDSEELAGMETGDWQLVWENYAGVSESVDYIIALEYGFDGPVSHGHAAADSNGSAGGETSGGPLSMLGGLMQAVETGLEDVDQGQVRIDFSGVI